MGHETPWKSRAIGESPASSDNPAARGSDLPRCGREVESLVEFRCAVVSELSQKRAARHPKSGQVGTTLLVDRSSERRSGAPPVERRHSRRTFHRSVDLKTSGPSDPREVRRPLHARRRVETFAPRAGMELPEAGETSLAKRRESHRPLEETDMARYKKKPRNLEPIWPSSTKAGSCSSRTSVEPGPPPAAPRSSATVIGVTKSRLLEASRCPPTENAWDSTCAFIPTTSPEQKSSRSCNICCATCADRWSLSGTAVEFTRGKTSKPSCNRSSDFTSIRFPVTPPNSIPSNTFGRMASGIYPTAPMKIPSNSAPICTVPFTGCAVPNGFSALVSVTRNYRGLDFRCVSIIS